ncbi:toxin-antitoxin system HicB family antitoxin [Paenibacillus sp. ov031]|nr:toxin-antitoxin system HicB family antitoxin [Paenibacillus sp. ov031]
MRIPRSLHQHLVERASAEDVSLNQYCLYKLSR